MALHVTPIARKYTDAQAAAAAEAEMLPLAITSLDIDGGTDIGEALVDADLLIIDNGAGGTNRKTAASRLTTYIGTNAAATKAEMEAASSNTVFATPGRTQNHPGVSKCWVNIHGTDAFALEQSYNVDGATDESTGTYEITVTVDFAGANNNCIVCGGHDGVVSDPRFNVGVTGGNLTAGTFRIISMLEDGTTGVSALADGTDVMAAVFGAQ